MHLSPAAAAANRSAATTSWPSANGKILYSRAQSGQHYETLLWYEYRVDGRRYVASNYRNGGNATPFRGVAQEAAKRYPAGRTAMNLPIANAISEALAAAAGGPIVRLPTIGGSAPFYVFTDVLKVPTF